MTKSGCRGEMKPIGYLYPQLLSSQGWPCDMVMINKIKTQRRLSFWESFGGMCLEPHPLPLPVLVVIVLCFFVR